MAMYQIDYRKGHAGVGSRDDYTYVIEADNAEMAVPDEARDWPRRWLGDQLLCTAPDESGKWEHYVTVKPDAEEEE